MGEQRIAGHLQLGLFLETAYLSRRSRFRIHGGEGGAQGRRRGSRSFLGTDSRWAAATVIQSGSSVGSCLREQVTLAGRKCGRQSDSNDNRRAYSGDGFLERVTSPVVSLRIQLAWSNCFEMANGDIEPAKKPQVGTSWFGGDGDVGGVGAVVYCLCS